MPNNITNVGFQSPGYDYGADLAQIERSRALAAQLQQQSMQTEPTQSVGGWAIRQSPFSGLAKALQAGASGYAQSKADQQQRDLATKAQTDYSSMVARGIQQLQGTAGAPMPSADLGGGPAQPAAQPDPAGAMATFGSHPMGAQFVPMAMQEVQNQQRQRMLAAALRQGQPNPMAPGSGSSVLAGSGSATPPAQGGFGAGIPPQIMALLSSGDSELVGIGKALLEANKGVAQRAGAPVVNPFTGQVIAQPTPAVPAGIGLQVGPGGPQAYPVPGAQGAMWSLASSLAGAQEAGKAPYELGTYNTPGSPTVLTREDAIELATGRPMPRPAQPQQAPQQQPSTQPGLPGNVPPQDAAAFEYVRDQARQGLPARAMGNSRYSGPETKAPGMRLQDQGESAQQHAGGTEVGKFFGDTYAQLQRGAMDANGKLSRLSRMESLLKDVDTGKLTPAGTTIAAYAKSIGLDIDQKLDNKQAAEALTNEIALQARNPSGGAGMPGALSDADRNFLSSMTPNIAKTPGARDLIMDTSRKLAKRDQEVAKLARDYYKTHSNTLDNGFFDELQNFSNANPLFGDMKATAATGQMYATNPQTKQRIVSTDGGQTWKPAQ